MKIHYRKGLSAAKSHERHGLIYLEHRARQDALTSYCAERCAEHALGLADCTDVCIVSSHLRWGRAAGSLWVVITVYINPSLRRYEWQYRVPYEKLRELSSRQVDKILLRKGE